MSRRGAPESDHIEFLEPRDLAFGGEAPADFAGIDLDEVPEPDVGEPRSTWLVAVGGVLVVALVAVGVVAAAPWSSDGETAPTPSVPTSPVPASTVPTSSVPATTTDAAATLAERQPGYVLDVVPKGMRLWDAANTTRGLDTSDVPAGWGEVWAEPGSTRTTGRWFSMELLNGWTADLRQDAERVQLLGRIGLLSATPDGVLRLVAPVPGTAARSLAISSFGFTPEALTSLFQFVAIDDDRPQLADDRLLISDPTITRGMERLAAGSTRDDLVSDYLWGRGTTSTWYRADDLGHDLVVITSVADGQAGALRDLLVTPVEVDRITFGGLPDDLLFGTIAFVGGEQAFLARWDEGDTTVTVYSTLRPPDLLALIPDLRQASSDEWEAVKSEARQTTAPSAIDGTSAVVDVPIDLGGGTLSADRPWSATLEPPSLLTVRFGDDTSTSFGLDLDTPVDLWASESWGVAIAFVDAASPARTLRVRTPGDTLAEIALVDIATVDPTSSFAGRAAGFAFDQIGPCTVELLDEHGRIVDRVRTPGFDT